MECPNHHETPKRSMISGGNYASYVMLNSAAIEQKLAAISGSRVRRFINGSELMLLASGHS